MPIPRRPGDLEPIDVGSCLELLGATPFVRLGFLTDGTPTILPVNHVLLDGTLYFRTAAGGKLASAAAQQRVAVEADGIDVDRHVGWSVVAHGSASIITDPTVLERLHSTSSSPWTSPDEKVFWVGVTLDNIAGRRIIPPTPASGSPGG
jgi:uncharacterized protein